MRAKPAIYQTLRGFPSTGQSNLATMERPTKAHRLDMIMWLFTLQQRGSSRLGKNMINEAGAQPCKCRVGRMTPAALMLRATMAWFLTVPAAHCYANHVFARRIPPLDLSTRWSCTRSAKRPWKRRCLCERLLFKWADHLLFQSTTVECRGGRTNPKISRRVSNMRGTV